MGRKGERKRKSEYVRRKIKKLESHIKNAGEIMNNETGIMRKRLRKERDRDDKKAKNENGTIYKSNEGKEEIVGGIH